MSARFKVFLIALGLGMTLQSPPTATADSYTFESHGSIEVSKSKSGKKYGKKYGVVIEEHAVSEKRAISKYAKKYAPRPVRLLPAPGEVEEVVRIRRPVVGIIPAPPGFIEPVGPPSGFKPPQNQIIGPNGEFIPVKPEQGGGHQEGPVAQLPVVRINPFLPPVGILPFVQTNGTQ
ncbi:MAG: hypothetical protein KDD68_19395 [Bdellovibrionales bacterium]|nr:hypothetical protein [Bdellovibrionales bacterium]